MNYHEGTCLVDLMMHSGKINYVVQNLLGYNNIGEAMGYSKEENDWCRENEHIDKKTSLDGRMLPAVRRGMQVRREDS